MSQAEASFHQKVAGRFSRSAKGYGEYSSIQMEIAGSLLQRIPADPGHSVLDIGLGNGALLSEIYRRYPGLLPVGLDVARNMVQAAAQMLPQANMVQADAAHLPFKDWSFDLVVSTSTYQWVLNLSQAFADVERVLTKGGRFYAALFGRESMWEFFESVQAADLQRGRLEAFQLRRLPDVKAVRSALKHADFEHRGVETEKRTVWFRDLLSVFHWLKGIGANSNTRSIFIGREMFQEMEYYYTERFGSSEGLPVTFEIIWINAAKS